MSDRQILALEDLYTKVRAHMHLEANTVPHAFGWRESAKQGGGSDRIVWYPGNPSGDIGKILPAKYPGRLEPARPLLTLEELFTVEISAAAAEPDSLVDETAAYHRARMLYDAWLRAVWYAAVGTFSIVSQQWITDKLQARYGACIRVVGAIQSMIPDLPVTLAPADARAEITPSLINEATETSTADIVIIAPEPEE